MFTLLICARAVRVIHEMEENDDTVSTTTLPSYINTTIDNLCHVYTLSNNIEKLNNTWMDGGGGGGGEYNNHDPEDLVNYQKQLLSLLESGIDTVIGGLNQLKQISQLVPQLTLLLTAATTKEPTAVIITIPPLPPPPSLLPGTSAAMPPSTAPPSAAAADYDFGYKEFKKENDDLSAKFFDLACGDIDSNLYYSLLCTDFSVLYNKNSQSNDDSWDAKRIYTFIAWYQHHCSGSNSSSSNDNGGGGGNWLPRLYRINDVARFAFDMKPLTQLIMSDRMRIRYMIGLTLRPGELRRSYWYNKAFKEYTRNMLCKFVLVFYFLLFKHDVTISDKMQFQMCFILSKLPVVKYIPHFSHNLSKLYKRIYIVKTHKKLTKTNIYKTVTKMNNINCRKVQKQRRPNRDPNPGLEA